MTTAEAVYCTGRVWRDGQERYCAARIGLHHWTDVDGKPRAACHQHRGGMLRRYPTELPERTAPTGTLGLGTPWTRGKFAPSDVVLIENAIPAGYLINVLALNPHRFVLVALRGSRDGQPVELWRTVPTSDPVRVAWSVIERMGLPE